MGKGKGGGADLESNGDWGFGGNGIKEAGKSGGKMNDGPPCNDTWGVKNHGIEDEAAKGGKLVKVPGETPWGFTGKGIVDAGK